MEQQNNNFNIDVEIKRLKRKKRKRRLRLRIFKVVNVVVCAVTFLVIGVCMIILKRPEISETENRKLAKWPDFSFNDYFSGKYTAGIENHYNDTVPGRETFKAMVASIRDCFGVRSDEARIHGTVITKDEKKEKTTEAEEIILPEETASAEKSTESTSEAAASPTEKDDWDDPAVEGEISNSILVYKNRGIMLYGGSYENGGIYAESVNAFKRDLGDDVNVYSMVCPTPVSYYLPEKYSDMSGSEKDNIDNINSLLEDVIPVDAYGALMPHKKEDIFKRTDHHWSQLGAYYAAEEFAKAAGVPFADINCYEKEEHSGYVGTLYGYSGDADLKNNPEDFVCYRPKNNYQTEYFSPDLSEQWEGSLMMNIDRLDTVSWYLVFMGSDNQVAHITTDTGNGRKLAIIKDSYGNALVPCLTSSFEEIYVIDMRYFEVNAVSALKEWGVTDLLFAMNTFSATGSNFECLETIRTQ
ncbi:MAG: DHHW family protein [Porcipelethomonas sp.]